MRFLEIFGVFSRPADPRSQEAIERDVATELAHHVALATEELTAEGLDPVVAEREAGRRFGDVRTIHAACLRTQMGERFMGKRLHVLLTGALALGFLVLAWASVASHREALAMAERAQAEARTLAERAQAALAERMADEDQRPVDELVIGVGDTIEIVDELNPDRRTIERVGRDGQILIPAVGWMKLAGKTRDEAEEEVSEASRVFYTQSQVRLKVDPYIAPRVPPLDD